MSRLLILPLKRPLNSHFFNMIKIKNKIIDFYCRAILLLNCRKSMSIKKHIPRKITGSKQKIPYNIFQTFKNKECIPYSMYRAAMSWVDKNPEYDYFFYDDNDINDYLKEFRCDDFNFCRNDLIKAYNKLVPGAGKADIFRLMIIYEKGGVYMDIDTVCVNPLASFIEKDDQVVTGIGGRGDFHQWGLVYVKNHPFIKKALENSIHNIIHEQFIGDFKSLEGLTGPPCLDLSIKQVLGKKISEKFEPGVFVEKGLRYKILLKDFFDNNVVFKYPNYDRDLQRVGAKHWLEDKNTLFNYDGLEKR